MDTIATPSGARNRMPPTVSSYPASGGADIKLNSGTQALSFRVDEMGRNDLDLHFLAMHGADGTDDLALAGIAAFDKAKADGMPKTGRIGDRGHPPLIVVHIGRGIAVDEMHARNQWLRRVHWLEPHQFHRIFADHLGPLAQDITDAVLLLAHHPAHTKVMRGGLPVQFIPRRMALFNPHDAKSLGAIRYRTVF